MRGNVIALTRLGATDGVAAGTLNLLKDLREQRQRLILSGEIPSPRNPPPGCPFHPRCRYAEEEPALQSPDGEERLAACFFPERVQTVFTLGAA